MTRIRKEPNRYWSKEDKLKLINEVLKFNPPVKDMNYVMTQAKFNRLHDSVFYQNARLRTEMQYEHKGVVDKYGELIANYQSMLDRMEELELDYSNTAAYSPREKTVAAKWTDLYVDEDIKTERLARLNEKNRECCLKSNQKYLGRELEVLIENFEGVNNKGISVITGRTRNNKIVHIPHDKDQTGEFVMVKITNARTWYLNGELI